MLNTSSLSFSVAYIKQLQFLCEPIVHMSSAAAHSSRRSQHMLSSWQGLQGRVCVRVC